MDIQRDFLSEEARLPIARYQVVPMIDTINKVIQSAPDLSWDVYYIRNEFKPRQLLSNLFRNFAAIEGTLGADYDDRLVVKANKEYIKCQGSAFSNHRLPEDLKANHVQHVIITGVFAEGCVQATARAALKHGYQVTIITDALGSSSDLNLNETIHKLKKLGVATTTSEEVLSTHIKNATG